MPFYPPPFLNILSHLRSAIRRCLSSNRNALLFPTGEGASSRWFQFAFRQYTKCTPAVYSVYTGTVHFKNRHLTRPHAFWLEKGKNILHILHQLNA